MFVDILTFCSLSVLFCLFLHPPSFIFYVFLFLSFVLSLITCTIFIGDTITTIPCLFNYKCLMFKSTLIVVWQPSGYMVRAFHWQYGDILLAIYFFVFTYYFVLSLKNKYTILYYTMSGGQSLHFTMCFSLLAATRQHCLDCDCKHIIYTGIIWWWTHIY